MPKLSKIRLTGCKYDGLRKEHENSIFDLSRGEKPDHTLFTLKNGGGKGVMMQLIFQLLLPETKWGKNNGNQVISMFYDTRNNLHPFTFHVALEWVLDTIPEKRIITGIAVKSIIKNTNTEEEEKTGLSYYLYTYEHDNNGYYTIENLPLYDKKRGEAVDLKELENFLDDNKRDFIKYSQSSGKRKDSDYYRYLQSRGIHRSEWLTLKAINKSEGGISDYFNTASDNKSIFDKIIIPAISENIRNYSGDDENSLIEMFKSNLSITKDLPILLKRENDYKELNLSIDPLIHNADSGARFMDLRDRLIDEGNDILAILKDEMNSVVADIDKWTISQKNAIVEKEELNFKKDNLLYNQERNDYLKKEREAEEYKDIYSIKNKDLTEKNEELILYKVNKALFNKKEVEKKIENKILEKEMLIKSLDIEDIKEKAEELDHRLEKEWEKTKNLWLRDEIDCKGYINYTTGMIDEEKIKRNKYIGKKEELQNEINKFEIEKENLRNKKKRLEEDYDIMSLGFPERILEDLNISKEKLEDKLSKRLNENQDLQERIEDINNEKNKIQYEISREKEESKTLNEKIQSQEKEELELARKVSSLLLKNYDGSLLEHSWFFRKLEEIENLYNLKKKSLEDIQSSIWEKNIQKSLNNEDYFIPNRDILRLKREIEELDIHVETGTEYLQNIKDDERQEILDKNSGFIYSLVIGSEREWDILKKNINDDIFLNNLIPIYIRSDMGRNFENGFKYVHGKAHELVDFNFYNQWKNNIEEDFYKLNLTKGNINEDIKIIEKTKNELNLICNRDLAFDLNRKLRELESSILEKEDLIRNYEEELSNLINTLELGKADLDKIKKALDDLAKDIELIEDYIGELKKIEEKQIKINGVNKDLDNINQDISIIDDNIEEIRYRQDHVKDNYYKWKIKIDIIIKRVKNILNDAIYEPKIDNDYKTRNIPVFNLRSNELELLLDEREAIKKDILSKNLELAVLDNDLMHYNRELERLISELEETSDNWKEYKDLDLPLIEINIIIKELNDIIKDIRIEIDKVKSGIDKLEGRITEIKGNIQKRENQILKDHKRSPIILEIEAFDEEINNVHRDLKSNKEFLELCQSQLEEYKDMKSKLELNLSKIIHRPELDSAKGKIDNLLKEKIKSNPDLVVDDWNHKISNNELEINKTISEGESYRNRFIKETEFKLQEDKLKDKICIVVKEANINNFRSNRDSFKSMKNHFGQELMRLAKDKEKAEGAMKQWTNRASIYVIRMIETLKDMVSCMNYTNEQGYVFPLVKLKGWERLPKDEEEISYLLEEHFIQSVSKALEKNENIENLDDKFIESLMGDNMIFSKALQGRYPVLLVYKMTEKNEFKYAKPRDEHYVTWEAINKGEGISTEGSGGQTLSVTTFVTMMIMSFKKKHIGNENPSTILLLDNPFGKASGRHVLDPIFEIADKLNFQLICFAAPEIIKVEISERFPIFWELRIEEGKVVHGGRIIAIS